LVGLLPPLPLPVLLPVHLQLSQHGGGAAWEPLPSAPGPPCPPPPAAVAQPQQHRRAEAAGRPARRGVDSETALGRPERGCQREAPSSSLSPRWTRVQGWPLWLRLHQSRSQAETQSVPTQTHRGCLGQQQQQQQAEHLPRPPRGQALPTVPASCPCSHVAYPRTGLEAQAQASADQLQALPGSRPHASPAELRPLAPWQRQGEWRVVPVALPLREGA
jgi:hypothetical protein